ncbi:murein hydrolase activator EnvC family protein [Bacillus marasmi]|uniref:murein hydrolase activator EnvC family protein n=1 Tax=Bacillus marasmi TaxID=1926279 RepID=UPI0011C8DD31|nr:M23 family metallopeptidase [Bacillus marasmi]
MKRTVFTLSVVTALLLGNAIPGITADTATASKLSDLNKQKEQLNKEKSGVNSELNESTQEMNTIKTEKEALTSEMKRIDLAIGDTNLKMNEKSQEIETKKGEIQQLQTEVQQITDRITKRNELLKDRARSFQENGGRVTYIDVLVGAQTFGDFIDRVGALATILEADQNILRHHKEDKQLLEEKQKQVETDLAAVEKMYKDLEAMNRQLSAQKTEKDQVLASLQEKEEQIHEEVLALEEQAAILASQQAAIQQAIKLEEQRLRDEEAAKATQPSQGNNGGNNGGTGGGSGPVVSNGYWTKPAVGTLSSGFGYRGGENHKGIDIANKVSVPIVAAADGVVIKSYYSTSYGNCIFVSHYYNGQVYTTVYAHMSSRVAGNGATVRKGDVIGYMGNTGYSFGQHLHFELHVGEWNAAKSNAVNPLNYIPM